jgi:hypothetical protein
MNTINSVSINMAQCLAARERKDLGFPQIHQAITKNNNSQERR